MWDEPTRQILNGLNDHYAKQVEEIDKRNQEIAQRNTVVENALRSLVGHQLRSTESLYYDQMDQAFNALPEGWKETFGTGTRHEFKSDPVRSSSEQYRNRVRLDQAMSAISRGRAQAGMPQLTPKQLFDRALRAEFGEQQDQAVRQQTQQRVQQRQSQIIPRPTSKSPRKASNEENAKATVEKIFKEKGLYLAPEPEQDESF